MPLPPNLVWSDSRLDFFADCEAACQKVRCHVTLSLGETALHSLQRVVLQDLDFLHDLPLQTLNDRLKRYPFVDPHPFDELLTEMIDAVLEWLQWVTKPYWIAEVLLADAQIRGNSHRAASAEDRMDTEQFQFAYPMPLRLRDLQAMVRPFMEVRSTHYIAGLDAVMAELIRSILRLYHSVKAWDSKLLEHRQVIAEANATGKHDRFVLAITELCATLEMDVFEAAHRLTNVDCQALPLAPSDIEVVCQKLPLFADQRVLDGPPTTRLEHSSLAAARKTRLDAEIDETGSNNSDEGLLTLEEARSEGLSWWQSQGFVHGVPSRILGTTLLEHLVDLKLHPDPWVAEMLPRVLERIFGVQISCYTFMNRLLPRLGGYVDANHQEVHSGRGLPIESDPERCAETLLVFLRQWVDLVMAAEEEDRKSRSEGQRQGQRRRSRNFVLQEFLNEVQGTGHSVEAVVDLLEGARPVPEHVLKVPVDERRYRVDGGATRRWELLTDQLHDLVEMPCKTDRDLGPYIEVPMDQPGKMAEIWANQFPGAHCLINSDILEAAARGYCLEEDDDDLDSAMEALAARSAEVSETFALKLVEWPRELGAGSTASSTFIKFFSDEGRRISRRCLQGLPALPWAFGSDLRNTIVVDVPGPGVAPFHCLFAPARAQGRRALVVPLGSPMAPTYVVCPKYQPLVVRNGDRLVCHQWTFELRIEPTWREHESALSILTDEGAVYRVPPEGCHVGAGNRSRRLEHMPSFPNPKFALKSRLTDIAAVHVAFHYHAALGRWTLVDFSPQPLGSLLLLKPGVAYPLSRGLRLMLGPLILEAVPGDPPGH